MLLLAPLMLIGLGAIAAPIIIHLLDKSRSAAQEWPTLRFMRIANRQANRRSKLKNWIVLAARCLLITLVVLAMAKPYSTTADFSRPQDLPTTLVIVLDNSFSMGYRDGSASGGDTPGDAKAGDAAASDESTRFGKARKLVAEQIERLGNEDEVALILANESPVTLTDRPTRDRDAVAKLAREAKLTSRGTNMSASLAAAFAVGNLDADNKSGGEQPAGAAKPKRKSWRQVLVVTDMQASAWRSLVDSKLIEQVKDAIPVTVVDIGGGDTSNRFIRQTRLRDEMSGGTLSVEVEVAGRSSLRGGSDIAELYVDGQKVGNPEPIAQTGGKLVLRAPAPPPGPHACRVVLSNDRLPIDDRSYFAINVAAGRSLTIVDGDPSDVATLSGAFYFDTAISLGQGKPGAPALQRLTAAQLSTANLTPGGCLVLINVPTLDGSALNKVENYLRAGGNVVVALGDKVNVEHYNNDWRFLPLKLDRVLGDPSRSRTYGVVVQKADHPIFGGAIDLSATRYFAFVGSDPTSIKPGGGVVLASFSNGSPMMIESTYGGASPGSGSGEGGRVLLVTGSLDARWSNLPFRRAFVPLIDRTVNYMTRGRTTSASLTLGQPMRFTGPGTLDRQTITVTAPDGSKQTLTAALDTKTGQAAADYRDTALPGIYRVQANEGFGAGGAFAVNVDTRESILTPQDPQELTKAFGALPLRLVKTPPADLAKWNPLEDDSEREKRTEYWPWLLLAALLVFAIETVLSNYFTRRRRALPPPTTEYLATRRGETLASRA